MNEILPLHCWHSVDSKGRISLYRETCFLTVHMTINTLNLESYILMGLISFNKKMQSTLWKVVNHMLWPSQSRYRKTSSLDKGDKHLCNDLQWTNNNASSIFMPLRQLSLGALCFQVVHPNVQPIFVNTISQEHLEEMYSECGKDVYIDDFTTFWSTVTVTS